MPIHAGDYLVTAGHTRLYPSPVTKHQHTARASLQSTGGKQCCSPSLSASGKGTQEGQLTYLIVVVRVRNVWEADLEEVVLHRTMGHAQFAAPAALPRLTEPRNDLRARASHGCVNYSPPPPSPRALRTDSGVRFCAHPIPFRWTDHHVQEDPHCNAPPRARARQVQVVRRQRHLLPQQRHLAVRRRYRQKTRCA